MILVVGLGWSGGLFGFTCMLGRGRGRVPAQDLRSSSRARLSISNCLSCSRTEASREAVLAHCSIHTLRAEHRTGQESTPRSRGQSTNTGNKSKRHTYIKDETPKQIARESQKGPGTVHMPKGWLGMGIKNWFQLRSSST